MRHLSVKQKRLLKEWYAKNKNLPGLGVCNWTDYDEFTLDFYNELVEINDFETLDSHIDRFISDTAMADLT
jgi:hypothetical protein